MALGSALAVPVSSVQAGSVEITAAFGSNARVAVRSLKELKYRFVIKQQTDFSCGSAALATLLKYHYDKPVDEQQVLHAMYERGNRAAIHREGFSLLDMKQYLQVQGYQADGVFANLADLERIGIPAIVLIEDKGYKHFVVIKGVKNGEVLVGDPAAGLKRYRQPDFEKLWTNKLLFVIRSRPDIGRSMFNTREEWASLPRAPVGSTVSTGSLVNVTLLRPTAADF